MQVDRVTASFPAFFQPVFNDDRVAATVFGSRRTIGLAAPTTHAAFNSACTFGHGSGARFLNGVQSASDMRSKIAALTEARARMRIHQSAMAG